MTRRLFGAAILALSLAAPAAAQTKGDAGMDHAAMGHGAASGDASAAYMDAMAKMDAAMAETGMTGKPGGDFAAMMIPHHQAAIDMAKAYLASGENDPELVRMSNDIVAAQESEIAALRAWMAKRAE